MRTYAFTLVIDGDAGTADNINGLFEAGCDDATFSHSPTISYGDFDRGADGLLDAVLSAIEEVNSIDDLRVRRVESDDLVTAPEIAERLGRTRQSVHQIINGQRGPGDFPAPVSSSRGRAKVWDWPEVAAWAGVTCDTRRGEMIRGVNAALDLREAHGRLDEKSATRLLDFAAA